MSKTKLTAQEILQRKMATRDSLKAKSDSLEAYVKLQHMYAERAKAEYLKREEQVQAMEKRIAEGNEARAEADALRGPYMERLKNRDDEWLKSEEGLATSAKIKELDRFYHDTTTQVARINNGLI